MNTYKVEANITIEDTLKANSPEDAEAIAKEVILETYEDFDPKDVEIVSVMEVNDYK